MYIKNLPQIPLRFKSTSRAIKTKRSFNATALLITFYPTIKFTLGSQFSWTLIEV